MHVSRFVCDKFKYVTIALILTLPLFVRESSTVKQRYKLSARYYERERENYIQS